MIVDLTFLLCSKIHFSSIKQKFFVKLISAVLKIVKPIQWHPLQSMAMRKTLIFSTVCWWHFVKRVKPIVLTVAHKNEIANFDYPTTATNNPPPMEHKNTLGQAEQE
jgi:hypothetical protein